jgi:ketosteroid isomerase-like protein
MSQETVEAFKRGVDAFNRGDIDAVLEELDPDIEWHPLFQVLFGGEATVYRGHEGYLEFQRETNEAFAEQPQIELSEVRDLGEQVIAIGRLRGRGRKSGAKTDTAIVWLIEERNGKAVRVHEYLDPKEALEAAGLSE